MRVAINNHKTFGELKTLWKHTVSVLGPYQHRLKIWTTYPTPSHSQTFTKICPHFCIILFTRQSHGTHWSMMVTLWSYW